VWLSHQVEGQPGEEGKEEKPVKAPRAKKEPGVKKPPGPKKTPAKKKRIITWEEEKELKKNLKVSQHTQEGRAT
jgi:hypothetical protein